MFPYSVIYALLERIVGATERAVWLMHMYAGRGQIGYNSSFRSPSSITWASMNKLL